MRFSLTLKLLIAFLIVSISGTIIAALIARRITQTEFSELVLNQAKSNFISEVTAYYQGRGSWTGIADNMRRRALPIAPANTVLEGTRPQNQQSQPEPLVQPLPPVQPLAQTGFIFALADQNGMIVVPAGIYRLNNQLADTDLQKATPIELDGEIIGYIFPTGNPPPLATIEEQYLNRTNQALILAALGATTLSLLLGILLARTFTKPLREMTSAIRAMAKGNLDQRVQVHSQDEFGELANAFNQMSADLAHANRLRRQMTADIAHDLRTPLTVIAGYLESMRDGTLKPSRKRFDAMYTEAYHLQRLVEDLRMLTLADTGELALNLTLVPPKALLERQLAAFSDYAKQHDVYMSIQSQADLPWVNVDEERMAQVLGNLISNAIRHTPQGGEVSLTADKYDDKVELGVSDTGEGIPADALPHVFERFYRVDHSRHQQGGESGLGLAIAKSIVEAHHGQISVRSELGKGSQFKIILSS